MSPAPTASAAALALAAASPATAANFDGRWTMVAETTDGHCGIIQVPFGIRGGRMFATGGSFASHPIQLGGRVSRSGEVRMRAVTGPRIANGTGRFGRIEGRGTWSGSGPSGLCSGVWTASRY